jgi:hypothetical protein
MKALAAALLMFLLVPAAAAPMPPRGKFVYSDLCGGPQPWEVHGHRVELLHDYDGDYITIEFPNLGFNYDVRHATRVELDPATGLLAFSYDDYFDDYSFRGVTSPQELTGDFDDDLQTHTLPRVPNSWPEQPPCPVREYDDSPEFPE